MSHGETPTVKDYRESKDLPIGGQAVIEGVMIRAENRVVTAVRTPDFGIVVREDEHIPWSRRFRPLGIPVIRGAISFFEMMIIGVRTLNFSADMAMQAEVRQQGEINAAASSELKNRLALASTIVFSLAIGIGLFFFLPLFVADFSGATQDALQFNLLAGAVRLTIFLLYLWAMSRWSEIKRVFEYHGAEHKSIFAQEAGDELTVMNAREHGRLHPRCGTSFLLIVVLLSIFVFAIVDSTVVQYLDRGQTLFERFTSHLFVLPLISGLSFELLKFSGRKRNHLLTKILIAPGLLLQCLTTREPDDRQLEVALVALRHALGLPAHVEYAIWDSTGHPRKIHSSEPHELQVGEGQIE
tara:strand:- start:4708 stop:5772 length:1065 start_codon:yes stop_codon:yes gene_type:complete